MDGRDDASAVGALAVLLRLPTAVSAAVVFCLLVGAMGEGFVEMERPAARWMNEAPERMTELRQRVQRIFPRRST